MTVAPSPLAGRGRATWRRPAFLVPAAVALILGVLIGRSMGYYSSIGGESIMGVAFLLALAVLGTLVTWVIWLILVALLRRSVRTAIKVLALATVAFAAGITAGAATAGATGGSYHPPVVLTAPATIKAHLMGAGLADAIVDGAAGTCESEPDRQVIGTVTAVDLGAFGAGRLQGFLSFSPAGVDGWVLVVGSDSDPEVLPIRWAGTLTLTESPADRSSGTVFLPDVPLGEDAKLPGASIAPEWPRTMAGEISWDCGQWDQ